MTEFVYVLIPNGGEWEDLKIFLTLDDAKNALKNKNCRIEIFEKKEKYFIPSYNTIFYED
jgi:hypothetical protein